MGQNSNVGGGFLLKQIIAMCVSRNYPYPHHGGSLEIPRGRGVKILKESMSRNWNFQKGGGVQTKKPSVGVVLDIFWNNTISHGMARVLGDGNVHEMDFNSDTIIL